MNQRTILIGLVVLVCTFGAAALALAGFSYGLLVSSQRPPAIASDDNTGTTGEPIALATLPAADSYESATPTAEAAPFAFGPGFGRRMMGSGHAPGGLVAVSPDGEPLPADPNSALPENTAAQTVGDLNVTIALSPYPPGSWQNSDFDVTLTDEAGQAITDATVTLDLTMPAMWMPPNVLEAQHTGDGRYRATGTFTMPDWWRIEVIIRRGGEVRSAFFDVWV